MNLAATVAERFSVELLQSGGPLHDFEMLDQLSGVVLTPPGRPYLERPAFLDESTLSSYRRDLDICTELLAALPDRLYGGSMVAMAEAFAVPAPAIELIRAAEGLPQPRFGRVDALLSDQGLRVLEFNATSETGGLDWIDPVMQAWLDQPAAAKFLDGWQWEYCSPTALLADELRAFSLAHGGPADPTVAIVEGPGGMAEYGWTWQPLSKRLAAAGLQAVACELPEISIRNGRAQVAGMAVDVLYRVFELAQITAVPAAHALLLELIGLAQRGGLAIWTSIDSEVLRNKACMALLPSADLDERELAAVRRLLPETGLIDTPPTEAEVADLIRRQHELLVKPADGYNGAGVVAGWEIPAERWEATIRALDRPTVIQQRVLPVPEDVRGRDGTIRQIETIYGFYYTPGQAYGGGAARSREYGSSYISAGTTTTYSTLAALLILKEEPA